MLVSRSEIDPWRVRAASSAIVASVVGFVVLIVPAMGAYPGGTGWDRTARGNDFWQNYLCDLARTVALNGEPNPVGSALAQSAMMLFALGLLPLWWLVPCLFPSRTIVGVGVRALGCIAVAGALVVAVLPADRFGDAHGVAIVVAGLAGLAAASLAVVALACETEKPLLSATIGTATLLAAIAAFALYVRQFFTPGPGPVAGAVSERIALLLLLLWMAAVAYDGCAAYARTRSSRSTS